MLDLGRGARPDEQGWFHLQRARPTPDLWTCGPFRKTTWRDLCLADGSPAVFVSWWIGKLQRYAGTAKCDGTRTRLYWAGQLDDGVGTPYVPDPTCYVMTTRPQELQAFRWRAAGPSVPTWDGMGGS